MKKRSLFIVLLLSVNFVFAQSLEDSLLAPFTDSSIVKHQYYDLEYSEEHEQALWVYYTLTPENLTGPAKRKNNFKSDPLVESKSAASKDYSKTGYDRGHLCPAASMTINQEAMNESFYMSNMSPQAPELNRGKWKQLEGQVRSWVMIEGKLHVVSGPIFEDNIETIGKNEVTVPGYYYKAIYDPTDEEKMIGFIFPNKEIENKISDYVVTINEIESRTNIDFFTALPDSLENILEDSLYVWDYVKVNITRASDSESSNSIQCKGHAKSTGKRCKNKTSNSNHYCNRHQKQANEEAIEPENED